MNAFDQIGASISNLQNVSAVGIDLDLPAILAANLEHPLTRADINSIDVVPTADICFRDFSNGSEYPIE